MPNKIKDLTGQKFGRLLVIADAGRDKFGRVIWQCKCECGNTITTNGSRLQIGTTQSCGCLWKEKHYEALKKYNDYYIEDNIVHVMLDNSNDELLCDIDIWEKVKKYRWYESSTNHYVYTTIDGKNIKFHKFVVENKEGCVIDHINRNKHDNRRANLRYATTHANNLNTTLSRNNTSGYKGVSFSKATNKWQAYIWINRKMINLGFYQNIDDAIKARMEAEEKYHKPIFEKETLPVE